MNLNSIYYNKHEKRKIQKKFIYIFILLTIISMISFYEYYQYNKFFNSFKENFEEYKFSNANNLLLVEQNLNPFKLIILTKDLSSYLKNKVESISDDVQNKKISSEDALIQLNEIKHYNVITSDELNDISNSIDLIQTSIKYYNQGLDYFDDKQYSDAISCFQKVSSLDLNYADSLVYLKNSRNKLKESLFSYCDTLVSNDHYSEALSKISDANNVLGPDNDIDEKISDIKTKQQEYLDKNSAIAEASSRALTTIITTTNINTLNITSATSYLINVNLENQKTYIYKGKADKWELLKTFSCSTGVIGEETPSGSFSIKEKGDWFFSEKYSQGGKYWTQITGDILFHSLPFSKDKNTILDYTLNTPSSHGCIRLSIDDAKWIYVNIPKGSKVIIK